MGRILEASLLEVSFSTKHTKSWKVQIVKLSTYSPFEFQQQRVMCTTLSLGHSSSHSWMVVGMSEDFVFGKLSAKAAATAACIFNARGLILCTAT